MPNFEVKNKISITFAQYCTCVLYYVVTKYLRVYIHVLCSYKSTCVCTILRSYKSTYVCTVLCRDRSQNKTDSNLKNVPKIRKSKIQKSGY